MKLIKDAIDRLLGNLEQGLEGELRHTQALHNTGRYGEVTTMMLEARMQKFAEELRQVSALRNGDISIGAVMVVCRHYLDPRNLIVDGAPLFGYWQSEKRE